MRIPVFFILCSLSLGSLGPVLAAETEQQVTLQDLEQEALRNNPEIKMAEKRTESAEEKRTVASALPDPMIGYMTQNVGSPFTWSVGEKEMSMQGVVFTQEIPFPGKLSTMGRAAGKMAERERESAREMRLQVLANLRAAYYDYYLAYRSSDILGRTRDLMKDIQRIAETRYATGRGTQQDVLRAQLEVSMLVDRIADEGRKKESQASRIAVLAGRNPLAPLGRPAELPLVPVAKSMDDMAFMAIEHSPMLQGKQRMVEQGREEVSLSKRQFLPDIVVSGGWFTRGNLDDVWQASVMLKVPLYFWNTSAKVRAASADLSSTRYDYDAAKLMVLARIRELHAMATTAEHHIDLYRSAIIPQAKMALRSATSNYQVGKTEFMALLDSHSLLLKYQLMEQEELVGLHKTVSMIGEMTGEESK